MFYFKYALKSLIQRRRQYVSLFVVCIVAVSIIISLLSILEGMVDALNKKSIQFYGGELQLICSNRWCIEYPNEKEEILSNCLKEMNSKAKVFRRFDFDGTNTQFYFEGSNTYCRILKGVDFSEEKDLFESFTFIDGDVKSAGKNDILISQSVAEKLGCRSGDSVTIIIETLNGYINTVNWTVKGIFQDSSLFGMYTTYTDINSLVELVEYPIGFVNRLAIFSPENLFSMNQVKILQNKLEKYLNMISIPKQKEKIGDSNVKFSDPYYALITLDANRPEVVMMSNALRLIVYLIIIPLVLIVAIGISCSYRVVILKRIVETSTFRALGLKARGVEKLFFTEVLMILLVGFIVGTGLSFAVTAIIGHFNFSFIPAFDLFLIGGRIKADYSFWKIIFVLFIIAFSTLTGVFVTLRNIIRLSPAKAFATTV